MKVLTLIFLSTNILTTNPYLNYLSPLDDHAQDREIIIMINKEVERIKAEDARRKRNDALPVCPIEFNYWRNLNCA